MAKQRRWRCPTCGKKVRAPGQAGRSWCRFCEDYLISVRMTRREWYDDKNFERHTSQSDKPFKRADEQGNSSGGGGSLLDTFGYQPIQE